MEKTGLTKGRLSQLLDSDEPFGEIAARRLEDRLELPEGYFDAMDPQTLQFAVAFDALPQHIKDHWLELAGLLGKPPPG